MRFLVALLGLAVLVVAITGIGMISIRIEDRHGTWAGFWFVILIASTSLFISFVYLD